MSRNTTLHMENQNPTTHVNLDLNNVDHVSSNVRPSRFGAMLYVFEDNVIEVFHSSPNQLNNTKDQVRGNSSRNTTSNKHTQSQTKVPTQHNNFFYLNDVDYVPSKAKFSRFGAMLYIFGDNEAVNKMIIKRRSPTMGHQTPTRRHVDKGQSHT